MRKIDNCLLFFPEFSEPMHCSFPGQKKNGKMKNFAGKLIYKEVRKN